MCADDYITFKVSGSKNVTLCVRVLAVERFRTYYAMLSKIGIGTCFPSVTEISEAMAEYYSFKDRNGRSYKGLEGEFGVVAIKVQVL